MGYCAAKRGNSLPTFRDNLSAPSSSVKKSGLMFGKRLGYSAVGYRVASPHARVLYVALGSEKQSSTFCDKSNDIYALNPRILS